MKISRILGVINLLLGMTIIMLNLFFQNIGVGIYGLMAFILGLNLMDSDKK